jgi:hypothetical protein
MVLTRWAFGILRAIFLQLETWVLGDKESTVAILLKFHQTPTWHLPESVTEAIFACSATSAMFLPKKKKRRTWYTVPNFEHNFEVFHRDIAAHPFPSPLSTTVIISIEEPSICLSPLRRLLVSGTCTCTCTQTHQKVTITINPEMLQWGGVRHYSS